MHCQRSRIAVLLAVGILLSSVVGLAAPVTGVQSSDAPEPTVDPGDVEDYEEAEVAADDGEATGETPDGGEESDEAKSGDDGGDGGSEAEDENDVDGEAGGGDDAGDEGSDEESDEAGSEDGTDREVETNADEIEDEGAGDGGSEGDDGGEQAVDEGSPDRSGADGDADAGAAQAATGEGEADGADGDPPKAVESDGSEGEDAVDGSGTNSADDADQGGAEADAGGTNEVASDGQIEPENGGDVETAADGATGEPTIGSAAPETPEGPDQEVAEDDEEDHQGVDDPERVDDGDGDEVERTTSTVVDAVPVEAPSTAEEPPPGTDTGSDPSVGSHTNRTDGLESTTETVVEDDTGVDTGDAPEDAGTTAPSPGVRATEGPGVEPALESTDSPVEATSESTDDATGLDGSVDGTSSVTEAVDRSTSTDVDVGATDGSSIGTDDLVDTSRATGLVAVVEEREVTTTVERTVSTSGEIVDETATGGTSTVVERASDVEGTADEVASSGIAVTSPVVQLEADADGRSATVDAETGVVDGDVTATVDTTGVDDVSEDTVPTVVGTVDHTTTTTVGEIDATTEPIRRTADGTVATIDGVDAEPASVTRSTSSIGLVDRSVAGAVDTLDDASERTTASVGSPSDETTGSTVERIVGTRGLLEGAAPAYVVRSDVDVRQPTRTLADGATSTVGASIDALTRSAASVAEPTTVAGGATSATQATGALEGSVESPGEGPDERGTKAPHGSPSVAGDDTGHVASATQTAASGVAPGGGPGLSSGTDSTVGPLGAQGSVGGPVTGRQNDGDGSARPDDEHRQVEAGSASATAYPRGETSRGPPTHASGPRPDSPTSLAAGLLGMVVVVAGLAGSSNVAAGLLVGCRAPTSRVLVRTMEGALRGTVVRVVRYLPIPGYSRHDDSDPLENERRAEVFEAISDSPGAYLSRIADGCDIPRSTVRYHVRILEHEGLVSCKKVRGRRRLFPVGLRAVELAAALEDDATAAVLCAVRRHEPVSVTSLSEATNRSPSTISHHLDRLEEDGLVVRAREGRSVATRLAPGVGEALANDSRPRTRAGPPQRIPETSD